MHIAYLWPCKCLIKLKKISALEFKIVLLKKMQKAATILCQMNCLARSKDIWKTIVPFDQVSKDLISESNREYVLGQINEILRLLEADPRKVPVINIHSESSQSQGGSGGVATTNHHPPTSEKQQQQQQPTMENKVLQTDKEGFFVGPFFGGALADSYNVRRQIWKNEFDEFDLCECHWGQPVTVDTRLIQISKKAWLHFTFYEKRFPCSFCTWGIYGKTQERRKLSHSHCIDQACSSVVHIYTKSSHIFCDLSCM